VEAQVFLLLAVVVGVLEVTLKAGLTQQLLALLALAVLLLILVELAEILSMAV
jgi:hypothetical protein